VITTARSLRSVLGLETTQPTLEMTGMSGLRTVEATFRDTAIDRELCWKLFFVFRMHRVLAERTDQRVIQATENAGACKLYDTLRLRFPLCSECIEGEAWFALSDTASFAISIGD
jgi:hypothetical protein